MEAQGERIYSSHSFVTSAQDGRERSASPRPRFSPREMTVVLIGQEAGWAPEVV